MSPAGLMALVFGLAILLMTVAGMVAIEIGHKDEGNDWRRPSRRRR